MPATQLLLSRTKIDLRVRQLGLALTRSYQGKRPLFLGVMNGALFFLTDLIRAVDLDGIEISTVRLASYAGRRSTGKLYGLERLGDTFAGREVLVVDDILDTGRTLSALVQRLRELGASEVKTCVLLEKRRQREVEIKADWVGFTIEDEFVVGYGLDFEGRYRGLKQVRVWKEVAE